MRNHRQGVYRRVALICGVALLGAAATVRAGGKVAVWGANDYGQCVLPNGLDGVKAIAAGAQHGLALKADGTVVGWGYNSYGQASPPPGLTDCVAIAAGGIHSLALRTNGALVTWGTAYYGLTNPPPGLTGDVRAIAAGDSHSLALMTDGTVVAWGWNYYGQTNVPAGLSDVIAIAASSGHSLALKTNGAVVAWGDNSFGKTNVPAGLSNVVAVAAAANHNLALKVDGTVVAWGFGGTGLTNIPAGLSNVTAVAAGYFQNLALKSDGTVVSWGEITNVPPGLSNVTSIDMGHGHALALVSDGPPEILEQPTGAVVLYQSNLVLRVLARGFEPLDYQWRLNGSPLMGSERVFGVTNADLTISNAQFSDAGTYDVMVSNSLGVVQSSGAVLTVFSPPVITQPPAGRTVVAGTNITLWATATGTQPMSYQWQFNASPISGATTTSLSLSNVQSSDDGDYSLLVSNVYGVTASTNARLTVQESWPYTLTQPGDVWATLGGSASFSVSARGSLPLSYQWRFDGIDLPGETNAALTLTSLREDQAGLYAVSVHNDFGAILSSNAQLSVTRVAVWPMTAISARYPPVGIPPGLTNLVALSAGYNHLLGLKSNGALVAWTAVKDLSGVGGYPTALTNIPAGLSNAVAITAGPTFNLVLQSNGTVRAWGSGPTNVPPALSNVVAIDAGYAHGLALKRDGRVAAWAKESTIAFGDYSFLTNVPLSLSNVIAVSAGDDHSMALKRDGTVTYWGKSGVTFVPVIPSDVIAVAAGSGYNLFLQSNGRVVASTRREYTPTPWLLNYPTNIPPTLSNVVAIAAGGQGMALRADGLVVMWTSTTNWVQSDTPNVFAITAGDQFAAALVGDGSPHFTIQPASQTVTKGTTVRLHARAAGVQPLGYQWQLDGTPIPGATNASLTLTNIQGRNAGTYQAVVTNTLGEAVSTAAIVTIPFSTNLAVALNVTNLVWTTDSTNALWFAQNRETHDGDVAAQSGHIGPSQQTTLHAAVTGPGTLTFWWKASSEENADRLWFTMDYLNWATWISGETDWQQFTYHVPAGSHVLRWAYTKDDSVNEGADAGWLDEVVFTPTAPVKLFAPEWLADGTLALSCAAANGLPLTPQDRKHFGMEASSNLVDWLALPDAFTWTNGLLHLHDPTGAGQPQRYYRVIAR